MLPSGGEVELVLYLLNLSIIGTYTRVLVSKVIEDSA